mgnify:CR=1 FL=1
MKKRRKVLVALAMAVTMLTPTGISAAEYGQVSGLPNAQEEVQDADGITNDSNELPIVDEKDHCVDYAALRGALHALLLACPASRRHAYEHGLPLRGWI